MVNYNVQDYSAPYVNEWVFPNKPGKIKQNAGSYKTPADPV